MIGVGERTITKFVEKFCDIEVTISKEKGDFNLFALIEREDALGKWDVVVSARWIGKEKEVIEKIALEIQKVLTREEQLMLSRIVVLSLSDPLVQNMNLIATKHSAIKLTNNTFNGIVIKEAFLITSQR